MIPLNHVLVCSATNDAGIAEGLALGRALMEAHFIAAGRFAINLPDAKPAPEKGVGRAASPIIGSRLQFFGDQEALKAIKKSLEGIIGMVHVSQVHEVCNPVRYASCRRVRDAVRTTTTIAREIRRAERKAAEKGGRITDQLRRNLLASRRSSRLPYISLVSLSSGQEFSVRFETNTADTEIAGEFDSYGFSKGGATVPVI